jgi:thiamine biosynthesis lipoprotein
MPSRKSRLQPRLNSHPEPFELQFEAIGTKWEINSYEAVASDAKAEITRDVMARIEQFDKDYSRFRSDSLITAMSREAGEYKLPDDGQKLFDLYYKLYKISGGAVTPLIGQVLSDAGYDADYTLTPGKLQPTPAWEEIITYNFPHLLLSRAALLDVGAAGKGYLVDLVGEILDGYGLTHYCVDAGGDMIHRGPRPLEVGLEHPANPKQVIGVAKLQNLSLCGSAGNRRAWAGFNHIIDPRNQSSPNHILALWVIAESTILADALTTALYFVPPATLAQTFDFDYAVIKADSSLEYSPSFPAEFF